MNLSDFVIDFSYKSNRNTLRIKQHKYIKEVIVSSDSLVEIIVIVRALRKLRPLKMEAHFVPSHIMHFLNPPMRLTLEVPDR